MAEKTIHEEMEIPDYAIERIARYLLPAMQAFFESKEGQREYAEWLEKQKPVHNDHAA
ncbi:MAG: hypothetical protein Q4G19_04645 [Clostridia bacterium]|nr:hypothetical protein [Clostridia bacterium]